MNFIRFVVMTVAVFFEAVGVALVVMCFTGPPDPQWTFGLAVGLAVATATLIVAGIIYRLLGHQDPAVGLFMGILMMISVHLIAAPFINLQPADWDLLVSGAAIAITAPLLFLAGFDMERDLFRRRR